MYVFPAWAGVDPPLREDIPVCDGIPRVGGGRPVFAELGITKI